MKSPREQYDVSVIIPTYNDSQLLSYTLTSLVRQDISKDRFEVIVADDGSSDDTEKVVRMYSKWLNVKYLFQEDKGYRPGSARNMGIRAAEGRICLFIDASVILNVHCLSEHIKFYQTQQRDVTAIGYVFGFDQTAESERLLKELVSPDDPAGSVKRLSMHEVFLDVREPHYANHNYRIDDLPAPWVFYWTCHVSATKKDLMEIDMFDENYDGRWGMEDFDLGFRLHRKGVGICLLRSAESIHYPHTKDMTERKIQGYQNCIYFHNKFQTAETELYLRNYHRIESVDVNAACRELPEKAG